MMGNVRIIFFGTPEFAVCTLDRLLKSGKHVVAVVTAPDQASGRGLKLQESAVKKFAVENNIHVLQPQKLKDENFLQQIKSFNADLFIVVAFRMMPEVLWSVPPRGTFNLHASLLPQYRGAAPINHAVMNGEKETGVTTFFLKHEIDTGAIIFSEKVAIAGDETAGQLHDKLKEVGAALVVKTVNAIEDGSYTTQEQSAVSINANGLKHAPKIFKPDCLINWNQTTEIIYNQIRGLSPYPAAYTEFADLEGNILSLKIFFGEKETLDIVGSGIIFSDERSFLKISTSNGVINITDLQLAGKKRMTAMEFLRGFKIGNVTVKK
jgi:methionyl-tRNA formyltransferase